jgi:hypothetical protein
MGKGVKLTYKKRGVQKRFADVISNIVKESEYQIKPTAALQKFKAQCPRDEESMSTYPTDNQVKSYVSGIKNKRSFCETTYFLSSDDEHHNKASRENLYRKQFFPHDSAPTSMPLTAYQFVCISHLYLYLYLNINRERDRQRETDKSEKKMIMPSCRADRGRPVSTRSSAACSSK